MRGVNVYEGISTKYCRPVLGASAIINIGLIKDHSICGYTGTLKNMTHGSIDNPSAHHEHGANPQIAVLYAHPIMTSRLRLHIVDGFRLMYDGGPQYKDPKTVVPHGAVYVSTDPVALDAVGSDLVDKERKLHRLRTLAEVGRPSKYIHSAGDLGVGVADLNAIRLTSLEA